MKKRLHFLVEGPTEKEFVDNVLMGHLLAYDKICDARLITTSRDWSGGVFYKGGVSTYGKLKFEIESQIKRDHNPDSYFTTMVDYYGLPKDFPGMLQQGKCADPRQVVRTIESRFAADVLSLFPTLNFSGHFVPNVQCHEFEALLFADLDKLLNWYPTRNNEVSALKQQLLGCGGDPESVNTSRQTAPSKRIQTLSDEYDKVPTGALVAVDIGLNSLRQSCAHFDAWITKLEEL